MIGSYRHLVTVQNPVGAPAADGDGGFTRTFASASPATWHCSIESASASDLERAKAGTVVSEATRMLKGRYRTGITTETRLVFGARTFSVVGVSNVDERSRELDVVAVEVVT